MNRAIILYFEKHRQLILENIELSRNTENFEAIHDMRVSFKRIKILLQYLEHISEGSLKAKEEYTLFDGFYKKSGRLRDVQVQYHLLNHYCETTGMAFSQYRAFLEGRLHKRNHKYQEALALFDTRFFDGLLLKCSSIVKNKKDVELEQAATEILKSKTENIQQAYLHNDEKHFHEIRRAMKDLQYLNNILNDRLPIQLYLHIDANRLTEIGQLLGNWHDKLNAEKYLKAFLSKNKKNIDVTHDCKALLKQIPDEKNKEYLFIDKILSDEVKLDRPDIFTKFN